MEYILNTDFILDYVDVEGYTQYDEDEINHYDVVDAIYRKPLCPEDFGNPDICALPGTRTATQILNQNSIPLYEYDPEKSLYLPTIEKKRQIAKIKDIRYPMQYHIALERELDETIQKVYRSRRIGVTIDTTNWTKKSVVSSAECITSSTVSFSVLGCSGTGKSTAFSLAAKKYAKGYRHNFNGTRWIQIPLIRLTSYASHGLLALYVDFARTLDKILDKGDFHTQQVINKNATTCASKISEWICMYHIAAIVIDEIQFFSFSPNSSSSFENLVTITANTGVAIIVIGTPEAETQWMKHARVGRRMKSMIRTDQFNDNDIAYIEKYIIKDLWRYQWTAVQEPLSNDLMQIIHAESLDNLDLLTSLMMMLQISMIDERVSTITEEFIRKISERYFKKIKNALQNSIVDREQKYVEATKELRETVMESLRKSKEVSDGEALYEAATRTDVINRAEKISHTIATILEIAPNYKSSRIRECIDKLEQKENIDLMSQADLTQKTMSLLMKNKSDKSSKRQTQTSKKITEITDALEKEVKDCLIM